MRTGRRSSRREAGFPVRTCRWAPCPAAAVLRQVRHQRVHCAEVGGVEELAAHSPLGEQSGTRQVLQVERERGRQEPNTLSDLAGRQAFRPGLDQEPKNRQPVLVGKGREGFDDLGCLHGQYDITKIIELSRRHLESCCLDDGQNDQE